MEIQGRITHVLPLQSGTGASSGKSWKKQDYVLETIENYPKKICFNLWGDNIDRFAIQVGEEVTVQIDIESREYNGRWYTDVRAWRVDRGLQPLAPTAPSASYNVAPSPAPSYSAPQPQPTSPLDGAAMTNSGFGGNSSGYSTLNDNGDLPF